MFKSFEYLIPKSLQEVVGILVEQGREAKIFAGGTDLFVQMRAGRIAPKYVLDLKNVAGLDGINYGANGLQVGPLTLISDIEYSTIIQEHYPILAEAASQLGGPQTRNRATIGGNICNAAPSADMACPLLVLEGQVQITGVQGERNVSLKDFFVGPSQTSMQVGDVVSSILLPSEVAGTGSCYLKLGRRKAMDLAIVGVAALVIREGNTCTKARIALGAVAPTPIRAFEAEIALTNREWDSQRVEEASQLALAACRPISDVRSSEWYRKEMVAVLVKRALVQAWERAEWTSPLKGSDQP